MNKWIKITPEVTRQMMFKSNPGRILTLNNVTHYRKRDHGVNLKCDEGIVYFETDDVSWIISDCEDWIV